MNFLETGQWRRRNSGVGQSIAHFDIFWTFDVGREVAGLAEFKFVARVRFWIEAADLLDFDGLSGMEQLDVKAGFQFAVKHADMRNNPFVSVEIRIEKQPLQ